MTEINKTFDTIEYNYQIPGHHLNVNILIDGLPWDVKNECATNQRISNLASIMLCLKVEKGYMVANSFNPECLLLIDEWKAKGFTIIPINRELFNE